MQINRDAFKLAFALGAALFLLLLVANLLGEPVGATLLVGIPVVALVVAYVIAVFTIIRPVRAVVGLLQKVARREFDSLPPQGTPEQGRGEMAELRTAVLTTGRALEKEIGNLKRIESYRKDFLGNVSHELKTPIFAIHGFAETLLDGALENPDVRTEFVEKILRNSERLDNLASDLAEIAMIETGELKMRPRRFDLADLVAEVTESLESRATQKNITVASRIAPELPAVFADDGRIRQVLLNLVDNGIKYTNPGGHVVIAARASDGLVKVTVSDSGIGIAQEHIERLTERFYRVDASRSRSQGGTGLGLAIVKHILSAHGGRLLVQSKPGGGSTFSFSLPTSAEARQTATPNG